MISNDLIINIKYNKNENLIYSSNFKGEITTFSLDGKEVEKIKTNFNFPIYDMLKVDDQLWIASQAGLILWENNTPKTIFNEDMVFNLALKGNNIYFGTRSAIFSTNKNKHDSTKIVLNKKR
uniref:hypothetical protein n=1 Tax=Shewanella phaeophyticola TaxID=2978345 RepID=UPI0036F36BE6